ncbi:hypothetical protein [Roseibacillus persicicus]|uniref:Cellobiose phosphorylase n=1 Tax=Roseibacillus persicicus TaxID=454148 RepID=A0A918TS80_9BACT|nr:hypothetical protein [Roseibacillus persicicus]GHC60169.1 hypothetical protein GCM10007100_29290 [Roseibacillus persicicus]
MTQPRKPETLFEVPSTPSTRFQSANRWTVDSGEEYVVIEEMESFEPFFLNIVGSGDQWLFCSSDGALTAGRESAETALFPYETVDKIMGNWNITGPWTAIVSDGVLWNPFRPSIALLTPTRRRLMKSLLGDEVVFDERHEELALRFTYRWQFSKKYGFVRRAKLSNDGSESRSLRLVDGLQNLLPAGVGTRMQQEYSCLADAYKVSELECGNTLMVHRLAAGITDEPIPLENMRATTVWHHGLDDGTVYTARRDAEDFLRGNNPVAPKNIRAKRGAFFPARELTLAPGESIEWLMVAEIEQSQSEVAELKLQLANPAQLVDEVMADVAKGREQLRQLVASADGFQHTADRDTALYHYHNALSNIMRGGVPENGYHFRRDQFITHLTIHNRPLCNQFERFLQSLPEDLSRRELLEKVKTQDNSDLLRLTEEYLPLIVSRRHGDPSRPWNRFFIRVEDEAGHPVHHYEGNWRDIFQNWEALALSYPDFVGSFISKFLNASTIDGNNPYRVTSEGIDWEAPDKDDPWASIGYWGDHQIVYLLKLLELDVKIHPNAIASRLNHSGYVYTDVPYRLKGWEDTLADPRDTVEFDRERHDTLMSRKAEVGADGLLLRDQSGNIIKVTLAEKLLLPAAVKLANLIPGGGIWMNTQRPEWNDANNALAGCGLSMVTASYLYRYLSFLRRKVQKHDSNSLSLTPALTEFIAELSDHFSNERWKQAEALNPEERFALAKTSGLSVEKYRTTVYQDGPGKPATVPCQDVLDFLANALSALRSTLMQNRRADGLWHSYNILAIARDQDAFTIERLSVMLEGQVAILSSGLLSPSESLTLLELLPESALRSQRHPTYLLYPDAEIPSFLECNQVSPQKALAIPLLARMLHAQDFRLLVPDPVCGFRFHDSLTNGYALAKVFKNLEKDDEFAPLVSADRSKVEELYEETFNHRSFTGRSGRMFGYEGLGCVYWHMVSKLMVAAQETALKAAQEEVEDDLRARLTQSYYQIQSGLGFRQSAEGYGAFPSEPYSHSPGHAGAQQPGLTGQVKEGILARFGELGVNFKEGCLHFRPHLLRAAEFAGLPSGPSHDELPADTLSFTLAQTTIVYHRREDLNRSHAVVHLKDGCELQLPDAILDQELTRELTRQTGRIDRVEVHLPAEWLVS